MDALTGLLYEVRSNGAIFGRNLLDPPWKVRIADRAPLTVVTMLRGSGWITSDGDDPVPIATRDVAIVLGPTPFTITDDPHLNTPPRYIMLGPNECQYDTGENVSSDIQLGVRTCGDSTESPNTLITGTYQVHGRVSERLLTALPPVLVVPDQGQLSPLLDLAETEIGREDPGQQAVLDRLLDLILLATLREWFARPEGCPPPWYRAMGDPTIGPALRLMHAKPDQAWTVARLASEVGVSRATLARRFSELLGEPPMTYLAGWRLSVAADLLQRTDKTVDAIARHVGYSNAYALSTAFKRHFGVRPTEHRALVAA
ncbi:AraC family transcriptional regulator [Natronoglycomyces albus]|uniref:AraC family transcriptional regulator n=1 Tax=Natronoglycomyces albus TaxID=2811108 RepID=A0A895XRH7_9ACTN|nr:AraC family transcriptional regulator [Natronoglycomyces albus]QSB05166.1 AraC family transcriptional regulator [Natronoglycomyces albus]